MKESDISINSANFSVENTYQQAEGYYNDCIELMKGSKYDFFNPNEELSEAEAQNKYNEKNRRLQTLGQAFELYLKYILLANDLEQNPNIDASELWKNWIRGHKFKELFSKATSGEHQVNNFTRALIKTINSFLQFPGAELKETKSFYFNHQFKIYDDYSGLGLIQRGDNPDIIVNFELTPEEWDYFSEEELNRLQEVNNSLYESCRYSMQKTTNYDFAENFHYISAIRFFATMIHENGGKIPENLDVAYLKTNLLDPKLLELVHKFRSDDEINKFLNMKIISQDANILAVLLSDKFYSIEDIEELLSLRDFEGKEQNLLNIISIHVPIDKVKYYISQNIPFEIFDLKNYRLEQFEKILSIRNVGEYIKENQHLIPLIDDAVSISFGIGIKPNDMISILNMPTFIVAPELLPYLLDELKGYKEEFEYLGMDIMQEVIAKENEQFRKTKLKEITTAKSKELTEIIKQNIDKVFYEYIMNEQTPKFFDNNNLQKIKSRT